MARRTMIMTGGYYYVGIPGSSWRKLVRGKNQAMGLANAWARTTGRFVHIHQSDAKGKKGKLLVRVAPRRRYAYKASWGMMGPLTEWACDSAAHAEDWHSRMGSVLNTGATAAVLGAGAAGLLGGLLKRPLLGTFLGAATGWAAHAIWTAPLFSAE